MNFFHFDPSDPVTQAQIGGIIRSLLIAAGGAGFMTDNQEAQAAGIAAALIGLIWSIYQKHKAAQQVQATTVSHAQLVAAVNAAAATPANATDIIAAAKAGQF